jgi:hypothetical protein
MTIVFFIAANLLASFALGGMVFLSIRESRTSREETRAARIALLKVAYELEQLRAQSRTVEEAVRRAAGSRVVPFAFKDVIGHALANYERSVAA